MTAVVAAIIENESGEILIAERPIGKKHAGKWEFPGGKVEAGESNEQAIVRELQEELHLDVRIVKYLGSFPHKYQDHTIDLRVFVVRALNKPEATEDVQRFKWMRAGQVSVAELAAADVAPLAAYLALSPID